MNTNKPNTQNSCFFFIAPSVQINKESSKQVSNGLPKIDFVILCQGGNFSAYRDILTSKFPKKLCYTFMHFPFVYLFIYVAVSSPIFSKLFDEAIKANKTELIIQDMDKTTFQQIIQWIKSKTLPSEELMNDFQSHVKLFKAANKYELIDLQDFMASTISTYYTNPKTAFEVHQIGKDAKNETLMKTAQFSM